MDTPLFLLLKLYDHCSEIYFYFSELSTIFLSLTGRGGGWGHGTTFLDVSGIILVSIFFGYTEKLILIDGEKSQRTYMHSTGTQTTMW